MQIALNIIIRMEVDMENNKIHNGWSGMNSASRIANLDVLGLLDKMERSTMLNRNKIEYKQYSRVFKTVADEYAMGFGFKSLTHAQKFKRSKFNYLIRRIKMQIVDVEIKIKGGYCE